MKKFLVAVALAGGVAMIAYASLNNRNHTKQAIEKQQKQDMKKKECRKSCLFG
jgi:hypothetical protein